MEHESKIKSLDRTRKFITNFRNVKSEPFTDLPHAQKSPSSHDKHLQNKTLTISTCQRRHWFLTKGLMTKFEDWTTTHDRLSNTYAIYI